MSPHGHRRRRSRTSPSNGVTNTFTSTFLRLENDGDAGIVAFCGAPFPHDTCFNDQTKQYEPWDDQQKAAGRKKQTKYAMNVYVVTALGKPVGEMRAFDMNLTTMQRVVALYDEHTFGKCLFEVTRHGAKGDAKTTYEIRPGQDISPEQRAACGSPGPNAPDGWIEGVIPLIDLERLMADIDARRRKDAREHAPTDAPATAPTPSAPTIDPVADQTSGLTSNGGPKLTSDEFWHEVKQTNGSTPAAPQAPPTNGAAPANGTTNGAAHEPPPPDAKTTDVNPFTDAHLRVLRERAIPVEVARIAGLRSVDVAQATHLLAWPKPAFPGLAIPYLGVAPPYWRLRVESGPMRYVCPAGREVPIYTPSSIINAPELEGELGEALVIVEAPLKALSLAAIGAWSVGLGGVATTLDKKGHLNGSWDAVDLEGRLVIVLFDANRRGNPDVASAEARLAVALQSNGRAHVRIADLPRGPRGKEGWGPDDFLAAHGSDALLSVIAQAVPGDPLERLDAMLDEPETDERAERALSLLGEYPFLASILERGANVRASARNKLAKLIVGKRDFDRALSEFEEACHEHDAAGALEHEERTVSGPYAVENGCLVHYGDEGKDSITINNFIAEITEEVVVDDGAEQTREFVIEGETDRGEKLPRITVPAREFASSSAIWVTAGWGSRAIVHADCMQHIHPAIQYLSKSVKRSTVYQHTGWRVVDGQLVYLSASGAVGAAVEVTVRLDTTLVRYSLPTEGTTCREDTVVAVRASLRLVDVGPDRVTIPLLASAYRAVLCEWLYCDVVVWVFGPTGALKSSLAALLLGHYGRGFDRERLTASWHDTVTSIESKLFRAKDALCIIDDFAPNGAHDLDALRRLAAQVIRGVGNGQSRSRMKSDLTARADRPPRALVMGTGEDLPSGESIIARTFPVAMRREDIRLDVLTECQGRVHLLPVAMREYIEWVARLVAADKDFAGTMRRRFAELRTEFSVGGHLRAPAAASHLALGWRAFLAFARSVGAIDDAQLTDFGRRGDDALRAQLVAQATVSADEDAVRQFLRWMRTLLAAGRIHLEEAEVAIIQLAGRETVGWRCTDGRIHLLPDAAYSAVHRAMREGGRALRIKDTTLWTRLEELGHTTPFDAGRQTVKRTHAGQRHRVVELIAGVLDDPDGPEDGCGPPNWGAAPIAAPVSEPSGARQAAVTHR